MGLSQEQIAFGIATMGVESGFNPTAQATKTTAYGLGQFITGGKDPTWKRAVNYYNSNYGDHIDISQIKDPTVQLTVMGAWIDKVWTMAQSVANDPRLKNYDLSEIAYGMWHEGFGTIGNVKRVRTFLQNPGYNGYNNSNIKGYFTTTYQNANNVLSGSITNTSSDPFIFNDDLFGACRSIFTTATKAGSPVILDLDGDGVETTSIADGGAYFDHDANGFSEQTGWASSDDGLLVMDRDGNGTIDTGKELFGDNTILNNGQRASNGFQALADLDSNADGKIDINDTAYSQLKIWQDADGDGYTSEGELKTLDELGIASINTGYTNSTLVDSNGNEHKQISTFTWNDGTTNAAEDVWFKMDKAYTIANEWLDVPDDIAALPDLQGYGNVYDLQQAMVRDESEVAYV